MARNDGIDRTFARNQDLPTLDDVAKVQEHNEREKDSYSNQDIDTSQTYRNIHFKTPTDSYAAMFNQMIAGSTRLGTQNRAARSSSASRTRQRRLDGIGIPPFFRIVPRVVIVCQLFFIVFR